MNLRIIWLGLFLTLLLGAPHLHGQSLANWRVKKIRVTSDTLQLDTLSIVPQSLAVQLNGVYAEADRYYLNATDATFLWKGPGEEGDTLTLNYRVFPLFFPGEKFHKSPTSIESQAATIENPFVYSRADLRAQEDIFSMGGLEKSGSISRGVGFGNNQDLSVNSGLNLSLSGKLTENIQILASVTDNNIPIQPEGNTAQLQDFDQVFIQLFDDKNKLIVGDFQLSKPPGYFMNYFKRAQGATFETRQILNPNKPVSEENNAYFVQASAAISKGKWSRQEVIGTEGNQGPYRLRGAEGEEFIIVLAGTERVYIDGRLLQRGQEYDYVIDYNAAEIVFTPKQLITKDKRITVEFQYSERNYSRAMLQLSSGLRSEKFDLNLNVYSEQDVKNQPLQQDLTSGDKALLSAIGNNLDQAVVPAIDSVEYSNQQILYALTDSLGYDSVFVYSTNPDSAYYRLAFSNVGVGNGHYVRDGFGASGRIFKWVAPDTLAGQIIRNGEYSPVILLVTPKKRQLVTAGGRWKISPETSLGVEVALSNRDLNTFSKIGNEQNTGVAARLTWENKNNLQPDKKKHPLYLNTSAQYELVESRFEPIERFRSVEFTRDWNLQTLDAVANQHYGTAGLGIEKKGIFNLQYNLSSFVAANSFEGLRHGITALLDYKTYLIDFKGSILSSEGEVDTRFERHQTKLMKKFDWFNVGYQDEREKNTFRTPTGDTLQTSSYTFHEWEVFVANPDTFLFDYKLFYSQRTDKRALSNALKSAEFADEFGIELGYSKNPKHQIRGRLTSRRLKVLEESIAISKPENTLLGNLSYDMRALKGALTMNLYYEIGSGLERAREFIYVADPTGKGPYTWIDYNNNNVQELNEFELARPEDGNRFLRIFTPTDNYIRAFTNQYSHTINWNPLMLWSTKKGVLKLLSMISDQLAFRIDRKTTEEDGAQRFNPFAGQLADSTLISSNASLRNTVFLNRSHSKYGVDYTYGQNRGKQLLTNGFDSRNSEMHEVKARLNISRVIGIVWRGELGKKSNLSDFLDGRNYRIDYYEIEPSVSYQPNTSFRGKVSFRYTDKQNDEEWGNQRAIVQDVGVEIRYNQVSKGSVLANLNMVRIRYDGTGNSSLSYEMLEGLRTGTNFTWGISYQRNLGKNVQLNLSYNGRKSEEIKAIHTGGVQVRAYF